MVGKLFGLSDDRVAQLRVAFDLELRNAASAASDNFEELFDHLIRNFLLDAFARAGADEGTVWLLDQNQKELVPVYNSGPRASEFVGSFRQSLRSGMISMVVATEQPICENEVHLNQQQDPTLDRQLNLQTQAMVAAPFYFVGELRGVVSAVQLRDPSMEAGESEGFGYEDLRTIHRSAAILGVLLEHRLTSSILALTKWA
jgi:transcriptional regulator with GAF, ATPase, and Fis domain